MGIGAAVVLLLAASVEASYLAFAPEPSESLSTTPGTYEVTANFETIEFDNGGEYIADGDTSLLICRLIH